MTFRHSHSFLALSVLLALFVISTSLSMLSCNGAVQKPSESSIITADLMPDQPVSPDAPCSQGAICGPIVEPGICGATKCLAGSGSGCCMSCKCIGSGTRFCAVPASCGP